MVLSHAVVQGVLVVRVHDDPGNGAQAMLLTRISDLIHAFRPAPVVIVLEEPAPVAAIVGVVLQVHRLCGRLGLLMSVATHDAPARRLLEAAAVASGSRLVIHARIEAAITGAAALTMAG